MNGALSGKAAIVTGAGAGLGSAICRALAASGAAVCALDLDAAAATRIAQSLSDDNHDSIAVQADVRDSAAVAKAVEKAQKSFGGLHILINNAGVQRWGTLDATTEDDWDLVLDTNLKGFYMVAKHCIPVIAASGGGSIVSTASVQGFASQEGVAAYAASKGGLMAMTRTLALDHARDNIRVNCVAPGSVHTPLLEQAAIRLSPTDAEETMRQWGAKHPLGWLAEPEDIADVFVFLASDASRYMTGTTLVVDGGLLARLGV